MSMPDWIIGDIHGRREVVDAAKKLDGEVLFLGDIVDSFNRSIPDQVYCLQTVLDYAAAGQWRFILANHEHSYLYRDQRCSGWKDVTEAHLLPLFGRMQRLGDRFVYDTETKTLFTHAGLTYGMYAELQLSFRDMSLDDALTEWIIDRRSPFYWVGTARGGLYPFGGPLWCDQREFRAVPGLRQVFGHTPQPAGCGIWRDATYMNWNIDCLANCAEVLRYDRARDRFVIETLPIRRKHRRLSPQETL